VYSVVWSPDSRQVFASGHDSRIIVHDAKTGTTVRVLEGHSRPVLAACVTPDGATIVTAGIDQSLRVWNAATGERRRVLNNHTDVVRDLSLRPDPDPEALAMVASVSDDGTMRLWQPTIGRLVRFTRLPASPLAVEWTPDGTRVLVTSRDGRLFAVDPDTLEIATALTSLEDWVYSIAVPPTERAGAPDVAIAGSNGRIAALRAPTSAEEETR
jgi:WD40 repeat protein